MPNRYFPNDNDAQLIEGCVAGHSLAQKYLYERYFGRLVLVAHRYARDKQEAWDILNQSFLKILQSLHRYQPTSSVLSWMKTIVVRTAINHVRGSVSFQNIDDTHLNFEGDPLSNEALLALDVEYIIKALQELPAATRTVFSLFEIDGYKHQEIAEMLNISVGTSKWHLSEAKNRLRKIISLPSPTKI